MDHRRFQQFFKGYAAVIENPVKFFILAELVQANRDRLKSRQIVQSQLQRLFDRSNDAEGFRCGGPGLDGQEQKTQ